MPKMIKMQFSGDSQDKIFLQEVIKISEKRELSRRSAELNVTAFALSVDIKSLSFYPRFDYNESYIHQFIYVYLNCMNFLI